MKKFTVIIENKNYRTKSHTSINAYNVWNRNWQIVDKQMIFELCYIEAIIDFYPIVNLILRNVMHIFIKTSPTNIILQSIFMFKMRKVT